MVPAVGWKYPFGFRDSNADEVAVDSSYLSRLHDRQSQINLDYKPAGLLEMEEHVLDM